MIVRTIKVQDIQKVADILRDFRSDEITPEFVKYGDEQTVAVERLLINHFFEHSFLVEEKGEVIAVLIAHVAAMPLTPSSLIMEEVIFYVKEQYRNGRAGYMLFKAWSEYAKMLRSVGKVHAVLMHTLTDSPIDMKKHGFAEMQTTYVME